MYYPNYSYEHVNSLKNELKNIETNSLTNSCILVEDGKKSEEGLKKLFPNEFLSELGALMNKYGVSSIDGLVVQLDGLCGIKNTVIQLESKFPSIKISEKARLRAKKNAKKAKKEIKVMMKHGALKLN